MNYSWALIKLIIYLSLIILVIYLFAKFYKSGVLQQNKGQYMELVGQLYLGQKSFLSLVKVKDKVFLLSIGENKIEKLDEWPQTEFDNLELERESEFKSRFQKLIKGNWRDINE